MKNEKIVLGETHIKLGRAGREPEIVELEHELAINDEGEEYRTGNRFYMNGNVRERYRRGDKNIGKGEGMRGKMRSNSVRNLILSIKAHFLNRGNIKTYTERRRYFGLSR